MSKFQLSPSEIQSYIDGESILAMSSRLTVGATTISNCLKMAGVEIKTMNKKVQLTDEDISALNNGESRKSLSKRIVVSTRTIRKCLKEIQMCEEIVSKNSCKLDNATLLSNENPLLELSADDIEAYKNGESISTIAKKYNVSKSVIKELIHPSPVKLTKRYQLTEEDISLYREGKSMASIARSAK